MYTFIHLKCRAGKAKAGRFWSAASTTVMYVPYGTLMPPVLGVLNSTQLCCDSILTHTHTHTDTAKVAQQPFFWLWMDPRLADLWCKVTLLWKCRESVCNTQQCSIHCPSSAHALWMGVESEGSVSRQAVCRHLKPSFCDCTQLHTTKYTSTNTHIQHMTALPQFPPTDMSQFKTLRLSLSHTHTHAAAARAPPYSQSAAAGPLCHRTCVGDTSSPLASAPTLTISPTGLISPSHCGWKRAPV